MLSSKRAPLCLITFIFVLLLAACRPSPATVPVAGETEPKAATPEEAVPAPAQPEPVLSAEPPQAQPEPQADTGDARVITPANLTRLTPHLLGLPGHTEYILWSTRQARGTPAGADLMVVSESSLYPIGINPAGGQSAALLDPILLPLNGNLIAAAAPDGSSLLVQEPGRLVLYSLDGRLLREIDVLTRANSASFSPDGAALVITSQEKWAAYVYGPDGSIVELTGFETAAPVYSAVLGPEGKTLAWISRGTLQLHDATAVRNGLGVRLEFMDFIGPVVFSPDGSRLALGVGGELFLYSVPDGNLLAQLRLDAPVNSLAFSPAGDILAGNYRDGFLTWDAHTLEPLAALSSGGSETLLISFSPDGRTLVTTHNNNELRVWEVR